jgi:hypothetical protein
MTWIRVSVGHEKKNTEQYQQWDVPVGQNTIAVNVDHLLPPALHSHRRQFSAVGAGGRSGKDISNGVRVGRGLVRQGNPGEVQMALGAAGQTGARE